MAVTNVGQPVSAINAVASSGTTGSFNPNAGSSYYVCVVLFNGPQTAIPSSTVAWASGGSGSWSKLASLTVDQFSPALEFWRCNCAAAPGASTISVTGNATVTGVFATVSEVTGDSATQPGNTSNVAGSSSCQLAITPNKTGSLCWQLGIDTFEGFTPTANGASTLLNGWNDSGAELWSTVTSSNTTAGTPVTVGLTNTPSAGSTYMLDVEVVPAAAASPPPFVPPFGFTSPQTLARKVSWDYGSTVTVAAAAAYPPQSSRPRRTWPPVRRGESTSAALYQFQVIPQATVPPQSQRPRRIWPPVRRGSSTPPWVFTVQVFPPSSKRQRRTWPPVRRGEATQPQLFITPGFPPQSATRRRFPFRRHGLASAPPPASVAVTVYPFQQPSPRRKPWLPPTRRGKSVPPPPPSVTFTVYPYPPQGGRPRRVWPPVRRGEATQPQLFITPRFPPQTIRRVGRFPFRRHGYAAAPTPAPVVFTVYPYPVPSRRRRWWPPLRRRSTSTPAAYPPPPPIIGGAHVTSADQATVTVTSGDGSTVTITAAAGTVTVSGSSAGATVTGSDTAAAHVTSSSN